MPPAAASPPIASLPMYDWPEVREATDQLWDALSRQLHDRGIPAPGALAREQTREAVWSAPELVFSQTCGLPFMRSVHRTAALIGAPVYDIPDTSPGDYYSVLVVRKAEEGSGLADFRGRRVAYNGADSQSGYVALQYMAAPQAREGRFFDEGVQTGSHRSSIKTVAEGAADIAAIDAVSWRLAEDHEPAADAVKVIGRTAPTPGLPYITGLAHAEKVPVLAAAVDAAIQALPDQVKRRLHLCGFRPRPASDYQVLLDRLDAAKAAGYAGLS